MGYLLVIDDDEKLCDLIARCLGAPGRPVRCCGDGLAGLQLLRAAPQDCLLVILDVMLPAPDGWAALAAIRRESTVPVLMLTAKDSEADKVRGLQGGADDYLTKPFGLQELAARADSLIRRYTVLNPQAPAHEALLRGRGYRIDPATRRVTIQGREIVLTGKEFDLLYFLAAHKGLVFTKQQIYTRVWGADYCYDDGNIMAFISKLRKKVEPNPDRPAFILTVYGVGYRFSAEV